MSNKIITIIVSLSILCGAFFVSIPHFALATGQPNPGGVAYPAGGGLVPCNGSTTDPCTWQKLVELAQLVINFLLFKIAAPLAVIMFVYAGFLYVTNGGNESKVKQAHEIFWGVFIGLVIALAAWLIINFILDFLLGGNDAYKLLG